MTILNALLKWGAAAGLATLAYARWVERVWVEVTRTQVRLPASGIPRQGLRILHVSDMHFTGQGLIERWKIEHTLRLLSGESLDLIAITGDLVHDDGGLETALDFIARLPCPRLGIFACLGNHDYASYSWFGPVRTAWRKAPPGRQWQQATRHTLEMVRRVFSNDRLYLGNHSNDLVVLRRRLAEQGIHLLDNSHRRVQQGDVDMWLAGIDDMMEGAPDIEAAMADMPQQGALRILLAHNPDLLLIPRLQEVDLALCGHIHGGQIRLPLLGAPHTQGTHLSRRRSSGWFRYGRAMAYIGRGLGEGIRIRFNCRPEVALIEVKVA